VSPAPTVRASGVVVIEPAGLLLVRRRFDPGAGCWSLPGGRLEEGESPATCAEREVREETGLDVDLVGVVGYAIIQSGTSRFIVTNFRATRRDRSCAPRAGSDAEAVAFFALEQLLGLRLTDGLIDWLRDHEVL
jgi:ADP-ribose pyrophosphatase YjhB (NUDIX family)